ncbi:phosphatidylinositol mannoside acyltransferase [Dactylosporangium fulvum]|uniref:Phosphatidylinositol mannoside acyltransferase n=1 Tax=Dactylosporangium fulvum TaxID=53359 RepID=A0ABY5VVA5_9ACTN|nr:phosphatidylinositol mannoside acyltransferase [Dactylosporangium fulvum]UWP80746.1 phosphatidylinositol mannoside acyltransferase [Dactylosporangium fulvum]
MNLVELGYGAAFSLLPRLPRGAVWPLFAAAAGHGARAYRGGKPGKGTATLAKNLRRVVGDELPEAEFAALLERALRSYARYYLEAFQLPGRSKEQILRGFRLERGELLGENVAAGVGSVVALPHGGNWDAAGAWVAAKGWPITTVAERLKPESVYLRFLEFRRSLGMEILPLVGGDRPAFDVVEERVRAGAVVPLLADRDLTARGVEVDFFGGRTKMPAGPALLALRTGAPLYVAQMWFDADAAAGRLVGPLPMPAADEGPLDVRVRLVTQRIADQLAEGIARHPEDWHMLQRLWLDEPAKSPVA